MANNVKYSVALKNAQQNAITTTVGASAILELYSGAQPANPDTAIGAQVLLSSHTCNATFAAAAVGGLLTLNAIANGTGTAGAAGGTAATWFRLKTSGAVAHVDGTVGTSGSDLNMTGSTSIATGQTVQISGFTINNAQ
jgi:hypothetical protein